MGREVRKVPPDWKHPKNESNGRYIPLYDRSYEADAAQFMEKANKDGLEAAIECFGHAPERRHYMPDWPVAERTHYIMYEDTTEGTPISPAFTTPEELARWLADSNASSFGGQGATYEQWLAMINRGWSPSAVIADGVLMSGVEASL